MGNALQTGFFSVMRYVNGVIEDGAVKPDALTVFDRLVSFVETCSFTKNKYFRFCGSNWKLSIEDMLLLWNTTHDEIKYNTMRKHIWELSQGLYKIFPYFDSDLFLLCKKDLLSRMLTTIEVIDDNYDYNPRIRWVSEAIDSLQFNRSNVRYQLQDLVNEIRAIKMLEKGFVFDVLDNCDNDKLSYICGVLQKPLYKPTTKEFSQIKLDILMAIGDIERSALLSDSLAKNDSDLPVATYEQELKDAEIVGTDENANSANKQSEPVVIYRDREYTNPYGLVLPKAETERLIELSKRSATEIEMVKSGEELDTLRKLLKGYSRERFEKILSMANPIDLATVLEELQLNSKHSN